MSWNGTDYGTASAFGVAKPSAVIVCKPPAPASGVRQMAARFASTCGGCGGAIAAGEPIRYVKGSPANHEYCGDPLVRLAVSRGSRSRYAAAGSHKARQGRCIDAPCCGCCD